MDKYHKVVLLIESSRRSGRGLLRGIAQYSRFHGPWLCHNEPPFYVRPFYGSDTAGKDKELVKWVSSIGIDGIIAFAAGPRKAAALLPRGIPAVVIPTKRLVPRYPNIIEERGTVGRLAAEHFLERGFRHFAFCGYNHIYWSKERLEGFRVKLKKAGFKVHVYSPPGSAEPFYMPTEQAVLAQWLKLLPKPVGLMVCNDDCGRGVMDACRLAGLKVPDEIAVLGVDDDQMICTLTTPPMSSVKLDFERAGYEAAQALDRLMSKKSGCEKDIVVHPMHVVTRQSTDVLAIEDRGVSAAIRFIRFRAGEIITVDDVVASTAMSRRQLERHFRQILARTILSEIHRVHIQRACELLTETNWPLWQIADHCGFSNATHLGIIFRQQMNMTCAQYRTGHRH